MDSALRLFERQTLGNKLETEFGEIGSSGVIACNE